jgi:hypothetical protein
MSLPSEEHSRIAVMSPRQVSRFHVQWLPTAALSVLGCALLTIGSRHTPWFDEAQAWLLARDNSPWSLLAHWVRYEGSPGLWHTLLWVFMHCGLPYSKLYCISALAACLGAGIILYRAPFPFWLRLGISFSYFFAYQYAVVARSYCLDLIWIPLAAALYATRWKHPLAYCLVLGLCANTSAHSFVFAAVLWAEFVWTAAQERQWRQRGVMAGNLLFALFAGAAVLETWPPPDLGYDILPFEVVKNVSRSRLMLQTTEGLFDRINFLSFREPSYYQLLAGMALSGLVLLALLMACLRARKLLLFCGLVGGLSLFAVEEHVNAWHGGFIYLACVFSAWVSWRAVTTMPRYRKMLFLTAFGGLAAVHVWYTLVSWRNEFRMPYSSSVQAAQSLGRYSQDHPNPRVAAMGFKAFSVQPWFAHNTFANYYSGAPVPSFYSWRRGVPYPRYVTLDAWQDIIHSQSYDVLLVSTYRTHGALLKPFVSEAGRFGYCLTSVFPGAMIWKTYIREEDGLAMFERCGNPPPASDIQSR